jgi:D-glycero-D-manno-heptose 1,7-bisphosphate phosphatase
MMNKAVFIDKDGTLIKDVSYNVDTNLVEFESSAFEALKLMQENGYLLVIITNQPGIAFEYFTERELDKVHDYLQDSLKQKGVSLNGFYYCPHHVSGKLLNYAIACDCRKPAPGLLFKAAADMNIDLAGSWMIGDILNDMEAGNKAGCKTILINNGNETEWELNELRQPNFVATNLLQAARIVVEEKTCKKDELV